MFGLRYIKSDPSTFLIQYTGGAIRRKGNGLSFFYYGPSTSLVAVPIGSRDIPFMISENTADFQEVTVQGQAVYQVRDPEKLAAMMNYTLNSAGNGYLTQDPEKLASRLVHLIEVMVRSDIQRMTLRESLSAAGGLASRVREKLRTSEVLDELGVSVMDLAIQAIRPTPETARALEASVREQLLREADEAIYLRRNAAVEQERSIKENELRTELAVDAKKREIREAKMDAERAIKDKERQIQKDELAADIALEIERKTLVDLRVENERKQGDARAYVMEQMLLAVNRLEPAFVEAIANSGMAPDRIIAQAFKGLASNAEKIGNLNISPELLERLMQGNGA
jgi:regulator of protease activity HflC (stomatin/prohibitin superfamily)